MPSARPRTVTATAVSPPTTPPSTPRRAAHGAARPTPAPPRRTQQRLNENENKSQRTSSSFQVSKGGDHISPETTYPAPHAASPDNGQPSTLAGPLLQDTPQLNTMLHRQPEREDCSTRSPHLNNRSRERHSFFTDAFTRSEAETTKDPVDQAAGHLESEPEQVTSHTEFSGHVSSRLRSPIKTRKTLRVALTTQNQS